LRVPAQIAADGTDRSQLKHTIIPNLQPIFLATSNRPSGDCNLSAIGCDRASGRLKLV
jgi:hypothetical protein